MEIKYSSGKLRGKIREVCGTEKEFAKVLKIWYRICNSG